MSTTTTTAASNNQDENKRKRTNNRRHTNKRNNKRIQNPKRGNAGILISCEPGKELKCRREGLDILLHYYHRLKEPNKDDQEEVLSLEDELSMLQKMNECKKRREDNLPFTVYDAGCRGMVFLMYNPQNNDNEKEAISKGPKKAKMTIEPQEINGTGENTPTPSYNPLPILEAIQKDILSQSNQCPSSRFILRMIPIQITCFASIESIQTAAKELLELHLIPNLSKKTITFEIQFQKRICSNVTREEVISSVADLLLQDDRYEFKVDLTNPEYTIMIQICRTLCGICVVKDYQRFMKFNLFTLRSSVASADDA